MSQRNDETAFFKLIAVVVVVLVALLGGLYTYGLQTVRGNELAVRETFSGGVDNTVYPPRTYIKNRWLETYYNYDMGVHNFVMNDRPAAAGEEGSGRDLDAYRVEGIDNQSMKISLSVRWQIDPDKLISIHKTCRSAADEQENAIEERYIRPVVQKIVKNHATMMKGIEAYSGTGLVQLQHAIEQELASPVGDLATSGIKVSNFVIEGIELDPAYIAMISERQLAGQAKELNDAKTKAAEAAALTAKAEAQADLNRRVVEAQRDAEVQIIRAKQEAQKTTIDAEASKSRVTLESQAAAEKMTIAAKAQAEQTRIAAEAERAAAEARAAAIKALGEANAESERLKFSAYSAPGAEVYASILIADSMGKSFSGIQGYLPSNMSVNLLSTNFMDSVRGFITPQRVGPPAKLD